MQIRLSDPQFKFVTAPEQFPAFCGGFGSGKTHAGVCRSIAKKLQYPKQSSAYYLPTYDMVRTVGFPRFGEIMEEMGLRRTFNKTDATIDFGDWGHLMFRTMDTPERIVGFEVADSIVDELDTLPIDKARTAWQKIISRNRQKKPDGSLNTVGAVTTPEGFRFVYEQWVKQKPPGYRLIQAATESNSKHLPDGYIDSLRATYPSSLLSAYLDGEFVNLTAGSVYPAFDRNLNSTAERVRPSEPLHIGLDFNVTKMAAVVHVIRDGKPRALDELTDVFDTPAMISLIKSRFEGHQINVYPDASGGNRKSQNASESDLTLLRQARFVVCNNPANPAVKDRVLAMNKIIESRDYRVNPDMCPVYVEGLEQQAYNKHGEPDKTSGLDHALDAGGYFITYKFPILKRVATVTSLSM
jgi:PBSX family phage terminase large subunit